MDVPVDITGVRLETERLVLRPWRDDDLADLYAYASVPGVGEMAGWNHHESVEESKRILALFQSGKNVFAVEDRSDGRVVGSVGLHASWADEDPAYAGLLIKEVGYVLARDRWGRGLMTEAVKAVIRYAFADLGLDALSVGHFTTNDRSRGVIGKCGFRFVREGEYFSKQMQRRFEDRKYILRREDAVYTG